MAIKSQQVKETPILYRLDLPDGSERVLLVTCQPNENILEWMWSDDKGDTWSPRATWKLEETTEFSSLWRHFGRCRAKNLPGAEYFTIETSTTTRWT